jgi:Tol biopolymer transport system component
VFNRTANGSSALYTIRPDGSHLTKITEVTDYVSAASPQWSPDGQRIAYGADPGIFVIDADGSHPKLLVSGTGYAPGVPSWSPDGTKLAFFNVRLEPNGQAIEVWTITTDGSAKNRVYHSVSRGRPAYLAAPVWSPDGTRLAFAAASGPRGDGTFLVNPDGTGLHRLSRTYADALTWQRLR